MEDELDDADSVRSSSSLILSSRSSKYNQDIKQQPTMNPDNKHISPKLINSSSKVVHQTTLQTTLNAKSNDPLDTKENILNQKPRQPSNHHRNSRTLNSSSRIKTDINLKPVVKRAAANKASDKIAKDSAALNRSLDQPFSTSTSDASSGKDKKLFSRSNRNKNGNITFSSSTDSSDSEKDKPVAKQKHQPTLTNNRRISKLKDSPKINSNTKKSNASDQKPGLDNILAPTAQVQFSRTTSDEEEKDFEKVSLPKIPHSEDSNSGDDVEDRPVVSFLKRRSSNTDKVALPKKPSKTSESPLANAETKPKRLSDKPKSKNNLNKELEEKENLVGRSSSSTTALEEGSGTANGFGDKLMLKNLSWPEQLARMKKARSSATRASLDSCVSVDSVELPANVDPDCNEIKPKKGQNQLEKRISKNGTSLIPKLTKGQAGKNKSSKVTSVESSFGASNSRKSIAADESNDRSLVYDFDIEEPISQSPHAKKKNKNAPKIVKNGSPIKSQTTQLKKSDSLNLPPQLEPQVEVAGNTASKYSSSKSKKSKEIVSKAGAKQPPQLVSHVPSSSSSASSGKSSVKNTSDQTKESNSTKSLSPSLAPADASGGNVKQISIMAFVKKRKEAAIAATKSPPKISSKLSDSESSDSKPIVNNTEDNIHNRKPAKENTISNAKQGDKTEEKKHASFVGARNKHSSRGDKRKSTKEDVIQTIELGDDNPEATNVQKTNTSQSSSSFKDSVDTVSINKPEVLPEQEGRRRRGRNQKEVKVDSPLATAKDKTKGMDNTDPSRKEKVLDKSDNAQRSTKEIKNGDPSSEPVGIINKPKAVENSEIVRPESESSPPIKISKKKLAMAGKYEKEKNNALTSTENIVLNKSNDSKTEDASCKEHREKEKSLCTGQPQDTSKDRSEKKVSEEEKTSVADITSTGATQDLSKNGTGQTNEFENMGYVSGDDTTTYSETTISKDLDKPVPAPKPKDIASEEEEPTNVSSLPISQEMETPKSKSSSRILPSHTEEAPSKPLGKLRSCMYETDKGKKDDLSSETKSTASGMQLVNPVEGQYLHKPCIDKNSAMQFDPNETHAQSVSMASVNYGVEQIRNNEMESTNSDLIPNQQQHQSAINNGMGQNISTNMDTCTNLHMDMSSGADLTNSQNIQMSDNITNIQQYNQHHENQATTPLPSKNSDSLGPSMGVYTPDSATNSVHSLHGGNSNNSSAVLNTAYQTPQNSAGCSGEVSLNSNNAAVTAGVNTLMESPNSISSVPDIANATGSAGTTPQHSASMAIAANSITTSFQDQQQMQPMPNNSVCNTMQQPQQHNMQHHPQHASPIMPVQSPIGTHAPQSIPSQSPHSQHNMTSPHHPMTSPHPSMTSPAHTLQPGQQSVLPASNSTLTSPMGHHPHQHMTSPHPNTQSHSQQPSPHASSLKSGGTSIAQTSPHPMTISPAAHSPYTTSAGAPTPGPRTITPRSTPLPQPSPTPQQQAAGLVNQHHPGSSHHPASTRHLTRSPHVSTGSTPTSQTAGLQQQQYYQQHHSSQYQAQQQHEQQRQMQHLQNMQRHYGNYGNYLGLAASAGAVGVGMNSHARNHHHAAHMQAAAAAMAMTPMFPPFGPTANMAAAGLTSSVTAAYQQPSSGNSSRQNPSTSHSGNNQSHHSKHSSSTPQQHHGHHQQHAHSQHQQHSNTASNNSYYTPNSSGNVPNPSSSSSSERKSRGHKSSSTSKTAEAAAAAGSLAKLQQLTNGVDSPLTPLVPPQSSQQSQAPGHSSSNSTVAEHNNRTNAATPAHQAPHKNHASSASYSHQHAASHQHHSLLPPSGYPPSYPSSHTPAPPTPAVTPHHAGNSSASRPNTPAAPASSSRSHHHHHSTGSHSSTAAVQAAQLASNPVAAAANPANAALMQQYHSHAGHHAAHHMLNYGAASYNNLMWQAMYGPHGSTPGAVPPHGTTPAPPGQMPGGPGHPGAAHPQAHMYSSYLGYPTNYR